MKKKSLKNDPIGVFDSGLGGLTVVKALMRFLPYEDIVYFGDTARVPYGTKSPEAIVRFSQENAMILCKHRVKMIVVACNSSSSYALDALRQTHDLPIVGVIGPGVNKALAVTRNKVIGVIATPATINSGAYTRQVQNRDKTIKVLTQACPLFVPLVEEGWFSHSVTREIAQEYLKRMKRTTMDTLILGCTHYPLLKNVLKKVLGPKVVLVDSAHEVARAVGKQLEDLSLLRAGRHTAQYRFLISDRPNHFRGQAKRFLGCEIEHVSHVQV
jgi:glutamate racemase